MNPDPLPAPAAKDNPHTGIPRVRFANHVSKPLAFNVVTIEREVVDLPIEIPFVLRGTIFTTSTPLKRHNRDAMSSKDDKTSTSGRLPTAKKSDRGKP